MSGAARARVAIVTGGGSGIGAATARRLAADGATVVVTGRRVEPITQVADEIGGLAIRADVADGGAWADVVATCTDRFGGVDVLVANAGVEAFGSVEDVDLAEWAAVQRVNVDGVLLGCRAVVPAMHARGGGAVVVVSSVAGVVAGPQYAAYVTSKTAVLGLVRSMAVDLGSQGIRVNAVCPGWTRTEMSERETAQMARERGITTEDMWRQLTRWTPLARSASADEVAACIRFLASDEASFVTGATLLVDGGGAAVDVGTLAFRDG